MSNDKEKMEIFKKIDALGDRFNDYVNRAGITDEGFRKDIQSIKEDMKDFVSRHEFAPVSRVVYVAVSVICVGFLTALVALVWPK